MLQIMYLKGRIAECDVDQDEPPVETFPDTPVDELGIEKYLPSVPQIFWTFGILGSIIIAFVLYCYIQ